MRETAVAFANTPLVGDNCMKDPVYREVIDPSKRLEWYQTSYCEKDLVFLSSVGP
jgi:hypothetical protein